jgi:diguanylate cyclase (GGDEF)-like protein
MTAIIWILTVALVAVLVLCLYLSLEVRKLKRQATRDPLTGVGNRRALEKAFARERSRVIRAKTSLAVILLDVDHFKRINDREGHHAGDAVLTCLCALVEMHARSTDFFGRFGGEEFVLLLPGTDQSNALEIAERIRLELERNLADSVRENVEFAIEEVTASFGVAEWNGSEELSTLIRRADTALYEAKSLGRNRVAVD